MFCFNCGNKLQEKFVSSCIVCGIKFDKYCANCNYPVPSFANFCPNCGSFISKSQEYSKTEELKKLAIMFADVSDFTKLSEKFSPDELRNLINEFFEYILRPVYNFNGIVDKFIGDCALIIFGLKDSPIDAPLKSVQCALEMIKLSQEFSKTKNINLFLSVGINYGFVMVGKIGGFFEKDYTVLGDVVNTAQRLQTAAPPNTIYVSESIYRETYENIEYSGPIELNLKNKSKVVKCYIPKKVNEQVEYNHIIEVLLHNYTSNVIDRIISKDSDFLVLLSSDNCGKHFIINIIMRHLDKSNIRYYYISLSERYAQKPFYLLSLLILKILNVNYEDSLIIKKNRLISFAEYLFKENLKMAEKCYNYLSLILHLDLSSDFKEFISYMTPEDIMFELFEVITFFLKKVFETEFSVVIIENLNLADKESLDFIVSFISQQQSKPFFIFSTNTELRNFPENYYIRVNELSIENIKKAVQIYFNTKEVDNESLRLLIDISEGKLDYLLETLKWLEVNKFYIVLNDIFKIVLSEKNIESIKTNIILNKIFHVENEILDFLKIAAVYGFRFSSRIIFNILQPSKEPSYLITQAQKLNLIKFVDSVYNSNFPDKIYQFVEPEIVKILLELIPLHIRKNLHLKIATTIEKIVSKEDLAIYYETLFYHYKEAGNFLKGANYLFELAMQYKKRQLINYALKYLYKLLDEIKNINVEDAITLYTSIIEQLASSEKNLGNYEAAISHYTKLLNLYKTDEEKFLLEAEICECYILQSNFEKAKTYLNKLKENYVFEGNIKKSRILYLLCLYKSYIGEPDLQYYINQLEITLKENDDFEQLAQILNIVSYSVYAFTGESKKAFLYLKKALNYANKSKNLLLKAKILTNIGTLYYEEGKSSEAIKYMFDAFELSKILSNRHLQLILLNNIGIINFEKGVLGKALESFLKALSYADEWKLFYEECVSYLNLGELYLEKGDIIESYNSFSQSLDLANKFNFISEKALSLIGLAKVMLEKGNLSAANDLLNEVAKIISDSKENRIELEYILAKTKLDLLKNKVDNAILVIEKAIAITEQLKNPLHKIKTLRMYSTVLRHKGEYISALKNLKVCEKLANQIESSLELAKIYYDIANTYIVLGNEKEFDETIKLAHFWAEKIDSEHNIKSLIDTLLKQSKRG
ncbi:hypothetical protein CaldiYA01_06900 [Caldicellulosiruptor diazotrophicus]|uniref:Guanylate cyclase domain-containing protein n=1 Tax=Caldicellulosiruptor diazotrophicus TaxID=2806205 RepID=A0ABM7NKW1_9FIRM|nr:hypothetical protein CaldiYA01_06900 [Caldicellulosiruptor diazotrophicus]